VRVRMLVRVREFKIGLAVLGLAKLRLAELRLAELRVAELRLLARGAELVNANVWAADTTDSPFGSLRAALTIRSLARNEARNSVRRAREESTKRI
jgi:hypothetical protein